LAFAFKRAGHVITHGVRIASIVAAGRSDLTFVHVDAVAVFAIRQNPACVAAALK